ncbi:MAG: FAD-binding oxidoreductase [Cohaesibacter sp.]|nr:FAD-binding oxidoreductase [Cohaesibacter sp.]
MKRLGIGLIVLSVIAQLMGYWPLMMQHGVVPLFSQFLGSSALIVMAWAMILSTRIRGLEAVFGPLDQMYQLHKWLAVASIGLMVLHENLDAEVKGLPEIEGIAEDLGDWGYHGLLILIFGSLLTFIPYHWWRFSHKFIGVLFGLCAAHFFLIEKPYDILSVLGLYVGGFCVLGLVSYLFQIAVRPLLIRGALYEIVAVHQVAGEIFELTLRPKDKAISHKAGQFAFLALDKKGKDEAHPFTISSAPSKDGLIRFSIKRLGDYTGLISDQFLVGETVRLSRGYGHFLRPLKAQKQIWVGAGIGITPFLAWAQDLLSQVQGQEKSALVDVDLYYCVRTEQDAVYARELDEVAKEVPGFRLHVMASRQGQRFSASHLVTALPDDGQIVSVAYCGPDALRRELQMALRAKDVPSCSFHYEAFEIRSGTGLWRLVGARLLPHVMDRLSPLFSR